MAVPTNKTTGQPILATDWNALALTANEGQASGAAAQSDATAANTLAGQKYTKPAGGIGAADAAASLIAPLGSAVNPITDAAAARPTNLPVVWWATGDTIPTNIANGDFITGAVTAAPGQVIGVAVATPTSSGFTVSWTALSAATSYTVEWRVTGSGAAYVATTGVTATSLVVTGLLAGTSYDVRVTAVNAAGPGTPSAVATGTTSAASGIYSQGFETDAGSWSGKTNATVARSTAQFQAGAASLAVTATAAGNSQSQSPAVTVSPGTSITITCRIRVAGSGRDVQLFVDEQTSGGGYVNSPGGSYLSVPADTWTLLTLTFTTSASTGRIIITPLVYGAAAAQVHYLDAVAVTALRCAAGTGRPRSRRTCAAGSPARWSMSPWRAGTTRPRSAVAERRSAPAPGSGCTAAIRDWTSGRWTTRRGWAARSTTCSSSRGPRAPATWPGRRT